MLVVEGVRHEIAVVDYHLEKHMLTMLTYDSNSLYAPIILNILKQYPNLIFFKKPQGCYFKDVIRNIVRDADKDILLAKIGEHITGEGYWLLTSFNCVYGYAHEIIRYEVMLTPLSDLIWEDEVISTVRYYAVSDILTQL